jgi:hypothetical protein
MRVPNQNAAPHTPTQCVYAGCPDCQPEPTPSLADVQAAKVALEAAQVAAQAAEDEYYRLLGLRYDADGSHGLREPGRVCASCGQPEGQHDPGRCEYVGLPTWVATDGTVIAFPVFEPES